MHEGIALEEDDVAGGGGGCGGGVRRTTTTNRHGVFLDGRCIKGRPCTSATDGEPYYYKTFLFFYIMFFMFTFCKF